MYTEYVRLALHVRSYFLTFWVFSFVYFVYHHCTNYHYKIRNKKVYKRVGQRHDRHTKLYDRTGKRNQFVVFTKEMSHLF